MSLKPKKTITPIGMIDFGLLFKNDSSAKGILISAFLLFQDNLYKREG